MAKFRRVSADEVQTKRKEHVRDSDRGLIMVKGFKSPPSWNKEERSARFVMSSETTDRYADVVVQSGLGIDRFLENPQGLLFHNSRTWPAGLWSDITKVLSGRPKRTEGKFNFLPEGTDEDADRAARHVAAGSLRTVSIGFSPDWDEVDFILDDDENWTGGFRFNKSELLECSLVPIPAQPDAMIKSAGDDMVIARNLIEEILDTYAKTPEGLLIPLDQYEKAYRTTVEKIAADKIAPAKTADDVVEPEAGAEVDKDIKEVEGDDIGAIEPESDLKDLQTLLTLAVGEITVDHDVVEVEPVNNYRSFEKVEGAALVRADTESGFIYLSVPVWTDEHAAAVFARSEELAKAKDVEDDAPAETVTSISVELDTTAATEKMNALSALVDSVSAKITKFFGSKAAEPEPVEPPAPPTAEAIEAARAKAAASLARLTNKGLVEA